MRKAIKILFIITFILSLFNIGLGLSFSNDLIDLIILSICGITVIIIYLINLPKIWIRITVLLIIGILTYGGWFLWQISGYESRIDKVWVIDHYSIKLQHRLHIAGPGCYWFLVNRNFLWKSLEYRIDNKQYQGDFPNHPEIIEFEVNSKILRIECCERIPKILIDCSLSEEDIKRKIED